MIENEESSNLRSRLITAALAALENGGEIGLRAITRDAGVSAMAPYRHFRDKEALIIAVIGRGFDDLRKVLEAADQPVEPSEALVAQGEAYIAFARARPALFRLMFGHHSGPPPEDDTAYGVLVRRVRQLDPIDPAAAALACWSAVHGMATLTLDWGTEIGVASRERAALMLVVAGLTRER